MKSICDLLGSLPGDALLLHLASGLVLTFAIALCDSSDWTRRTNQRGQPATLTITFGSRKLSIITRIDTLDARSATMLGKNRDENSDHRQ